MRLSVRLTIMIVFSLIACGAAAAQFPAQAILENCDRARGNLAGVTWTVTIEAVERGGTNVRQILVKSRGFDTVAETLAPPQNKGHLLLMLKGNMWFYKPDISKPVPISARQKLLGLASNGDIASTNYARDYTVLDWQDAVLDGQPCYLFDLEAANPTATYARIRYWVTKQPQVGIKAEFFNTQGDKLIKSATMSYGQQIAGRPFISKMVITDELMSGDKTILTFSNPSLKPIPDHVFNLNLLTK